MVGVVELSRRVAAPPAAVFGILADGWLYASWSVGAVRVTGVDPEWPARASRVHHSIGLWPFLRPQITEVIQFEDGHRVVLRPHGWPPGDVEIIIRQHGPSPQACLLTLR